MSVMRQTSHHGDVWPEMKLARFREYMRDFEILVVEQAVGHEVLGRVDMIPVRPGRLTHTRFGATMGRIIDSGVQFAVDYYGLLKRSSALQEEIELVTKQLTGRQLKLIECTVVHFASIRIEHVARFQLGLVSEFPLFKRAILKARGFLRNERVR